MKLLSIIILSLLLSCRANCQDKVLVDAYRIHFDDGDYFGFTSEFDYVFKLYYDSTVQLDIYAGNYQFMLGRFTNKTSFSGKARIHNDTIRVAVWVRTSKVVDDTLTRQIAYLEMMHVPSIFVRKSNTLIDINNFLQPFLKTFYEEIIALDNHYMDDKKAMKGISGPYIHYRL